MRGLFQACLLIVCFFIGQGVYAAAAEVEDINVDSDASAFIDVGDVPDKKIPEDVDSQQPMVKESHSTDGNEVSLLNRLNALEVQIQHLQGQLEQQVHKLQQLSRDQKLLYADLDNRLQKMVSVESKAVAKTMESKPQDDKSLYQHAYHALLSQGYAEAKAGFSQVISAYPNSRYLPNAYYWLGEIALREGELKKSLQYFETVVMRYPQNPKAIDARLKRGYAFYRLNDFVQARMSFNEVLQLSPNSPAAQLAKTRLKTMSKRGL